MVSANFSHSQEKTFLSRTVLFLDNLDFSKTLPYVPAMCELCHRENAL